MSTANKQNDLIKTKYCYLHMYAFIWVTSTIGYCTYVLMYLRMFSEEKNELVSEWYSVS